MSYRRWARIAVVALSGAGACYEYVPVESAAPPVGGVVELKISDPGRVGLAQRFGPGLDRVEGRLVAQRANELTLNVTSVTSLEGLSTKWSGESVSLDRGFIRTVSSRRISPVKTTLLAVAAGAVLYFTAAKTLNGSGRQEDDTPTPPTQPISRRIPIGVRLRVTP